MMHGQKNIKFCLRSLPYHANIVHSDG